MNIPSLSCKIEMFCTANPSESIEKIEQAISNIFPYWEKEIVDKIVARDIIRLIKKYKPFLEIDEKKFKDDLQKRQLQTV